LITVYDLEARIYDYFDVLFAGNQSEFGFATSSSACFFTTNQTNAPRDAKDTLLYYRVDPSHSMGNIYSDFSYINRTTGIETIKYNKEVKVTVNVLSKQKGMAKSALMYLATIQQTERHNKACYDTGSFDLAVKNIDTNIRDLTYLENAAWAERAEVDYYFNYKDTIVFSEVHPLVIAPSSVEVTKDKVDFDIILNN
jgi:hypothetical protein